MKNIKGNTLVEVIVSFVIIGILSSMMIVVFVNSKNVNHSLVAQENIMSSVENIFDIFSSDPVNFETNLSKYYKINQKEGKNVIYFTSKFLKNEEESTNYLEINYSNLDNLYSLNINTFKENEIYPKYSNLTRKIYG